MLVIICDWSAWLGFEFFKVWGEKKGWRCWESGKPSHCYLLGSRMSLCNSLIVQWILEKVVGTLWFSVWVQSVVHCSITTYIYSFQHIQYLQHSSFFSSSPCIPAPPPSYNFLSTVWILKKFRTTSNNLYWFFRIIFSISISVQVMHACDTIQNRKAWVQGYAHGPFMNMCICNFYASST